jgi:hypothetical protein
MVEDIILFYYNLGSGILYSLSGFIYIYSKVGWNFKFV